LFYIVLQFHTNIASFRDHASFLLKKEQIHFWFFAYHAVIFIFFTEFSKQKCLTECEIK